MFFSYSRCAVLYSLSTHFIDIIWDLNNTMKRSSVIFLCSWSMLFSVHFWKMINIWPVYTRVMIKACNTSGLCYDDHVMMTGIHLCREGHLIDWASTCRMISWLIVYDDLWFNKITRSGIFSTEKKRFCMGKCGFIKIK